MSGAIIRQGPHQGAQKSTSTGMSLFSTSASKVASVTTVAAPGNRYAFERKVRCGTPVYPASVPVGILAGCLRGQGKKTRKRADRNDTVSFNKQKSDRKCRRTVAVSYLSPRRGIAPGTAAGGAYTEVSSSGIA